MRSTLESTLPWWMTSRLTPHIGENGATLPDDRRRSRAALAALDNGDGS